MGSRVRRLERRLYRSEQFKKSGKTAAIRDPRATDISQDEEYSVESDGLARVKRFPMKPVPVDEAINQMELLGHDFFFFYNIDTSEYGFLYRRANGATFCWNQR